jgi:chemotaxis protein CheX
MQHAEKVIFEVQNATKDVFATMLSMDLGCDEALVTSQEPPAKDGVLSFIGFAGDWVGTGSIACSAEVACQIADALLMAPHPAVDEEVLDAVAEVTNMIIGNLKTALEEDFGSMNLSIPTVIFGRNFTTRVTGQNEWVLVPFDVSGSHFEVHVCLMPNSDGKKNLARPPFNCHMP